MPAIPHVIRRGAIYYWRRRLPPLSPCKARVITLSLHTADARLARQKAAFLTAQSQHPFEKARRGMLNDTEITTIMRLAALEIEERYKIAHLEGLVADAVPVEDIAGLRVIEQARVAAELNRRRGGSSPLSVLSSKEEKTLKKESWNKAMIRALNVQLELASAFSTLPLEKPEFEALAKTAGIERSLSDTELFQVHQAVARARAVALKRFADGADVDTSLDEQRVHAPLAHKASALSPMVPLTPRSIDAGAQDSQNRKTPFEAISTMLLEEKRKAEAWTEKTCRQAEFIFKLFFSFLEVSQRKQFYEDIEQNDLDDFNTKLSALSPQHGKAAGDADLTGMDYIQKYSPPVSNHKGQMAVATLNRHWNFLDQLFKRATRRGIPLKIVDTACFHRKKKKNARQDREKASIKQITAFFKLPIFTGCAGHELRKTKAGRPMYCPGEHVFHRAAYFGPMIAHYHGFRREEFCGLAIQDIELDGENSAFLIRVNDFRRLKNSSSVREHIIHPELFRLGFVDYVEAISTLGYDRVFPDLVSPSPNVVSGERLYDELDPGFEVTGLMTHQFRHYFNASLKKSDVSEEIRADLMGHAHGSETAGRYAEAFMGDQQLEILKKAVKVTSHLEKRDIRLLPWIARKLPPPWSAKKKIIKESIRRRV